MLFNKTFSFLVELFTFLSCLDLKSCAYDNERQCTINNWVECSKVHYILVI